MDRVSLTSDDYMDLVLRIRSRYPSLRVRFKDESRLMSFLGRALFMVPDFMTDFTTVIGKTVYFPTRSWVETKPREATIVLAHEYTHMRDFDRLPWGLGQILYLSPQVLSLPLLTAFFCTLGWLGTPWGWLCAAFAVLGLLCLAPWSAVFRTRTEVRGYAMSLACSYWTTGVPLVPEDFAYVDDLLRGSSYYFASKTSVLPALQELFPDGRPSESLLATEPFPEILAYLEQRGLRPNARP